MNKLYYIHNYRIRGPINTTFNLGELKNLCAWQIGVLNGKDIILHPGEFIKNYDGDVKNEQIEDNVMYFKNKNGRFSYTDIGLEIIRIGHVYESFETAVDDCKHIIMSKLGSNINRANEIIKEIEDLNRMIFLNKTNA